MYTSLSLKLSQMDHIRQLSSSYDIPHYVVVQALLNLLDIPKNKALFDHLVKLELAARANDIKTIQELAKESQQFIEHSP